MVGTDGVGGGDAFGVVVLGHADVGDDRVRSQVGNGAEEFLGGADGSEGFNMAGVFQQSAGASADKEVILGDEYA